MRTGDDSRKVTPPVQRDDPGVVLGVTSPGLKPGLAGRRWLGAGRRDGWGFWFCSRQGHISRIAAPGGEWFRASRKLGYKTEHRPMTAHVAPKTTRAWLLSHALCGTNFRETRPRPWRAQISPTQAQPWPSRSAQQSRLRRGRRSPRGSCDPAYCRPASAR